MAKNFIQPGEFLDVTAPTGGAVAGDIATVGALLGVAQHTAAEGAPLTIHRAGVYRLKKASVGVAQGAQLYWIGASKAVTTSASGNTAIGIAVSAADASAATVEVLAKG